MGRMGVGQTTQPSTHDINNVGNKKANDGHTAPPSQWERLSSKPLTDKKVTFQQHPK